MVFLHFFYLIGHLLFSQLAFLYFICLCCQHLCTAPFLLSSFLFLYQLAYNDLFASRPGVESYTLLCFLSDSLAHSRPICLSPVHCAVHLHHEFAYSSIVCKILFKVWNSLLIGSRLSSSFIYCLHIRNRIHAQDIGLVHTMHHFPVSL